VGYAPNSNVYLGNGWVLEAYHCHVGASNQQDYAIINGTMYYGYNDGDPAHAIRITDPTSPNPPADLYLFKINGASPNLPSLAITSSAPSTGSQVRAIGRGLDREAATTQWDSSWRTPPVSAAAYTGYWLGSTYTKRWGDNSISGTSTQSYGFGATHCLNTMFNMGAGSNEFQAAPGDSGGGVFYKNNGYWQLAGIMGAVYHQKPGEPQTTVVYGDYTYSADLSYYRNQIVGAVKVFQISSTMNDPNYGIGAGWESVQLIGNSGFGSATGPWSIPVNVNGYAFTVDTGSSAVSFAPGTGMATGVISGGGTLTKTGTGTLTLSAANTFSGTTNLSQGTLKLSNGSALQSSTLNYSAGTLTFDSSVASHAFTLGGLSGSSSIALKDALNVPISLSIGNNNSSTTYSGLLSGSGSIAKIGSGALTLTQALSATSATPYTGNTAVSDGVLNVPLINTPSATVSVTGTGTLNATSIVANSLVIGSAFAAQSSSPALAAQAASSVPEPGTFALLAAGLAGIAATGWLRRR
jgi:autotransporter-associated beta strand protein